MTERTVTHDTFTLERRFPVSPERVFAAFADPRVKAEWSISPERWGAAEHSLDFRVGGRETTKGGPKGGPNYSSIATYHDIVREERIVYSYEMLADGVRHSVSLGTVELEPSEAGTVLTYTEQGAYLDGHDDSGAREQGARALFDKLEQLLKRQHVTA
jgi:uncharacterized protein YndB with AHSA1/START domain